MTGNRVAEGLGTTPLGASALCIFGSYNPLRRSGSRSLALLHKCDKVTETTASGLDNIDLPIGPSAPVGFNSSSQVIPAKKPSPRSGIFQ